ncbi:MAG TPA: protein-L-isoaspartate(D-aspartate) O-methyltransferase [Candidatus Thermoplasmatota archaeon]|nr:protein-L-isoaspartate(D-aspartate) O-methyltransferase [Candidatus Thermoplasmatota archaeon]
MDAWRERQALVGRLVSQGLVRSERVRAAMLKVPRERFLPGDVAGDAYLDAPLSIGSGQTVSAPHMVAIMAEALLCEGGEKLLEIGTGSGYHAAVLADLVSPGRVVTLERIPELAERAERALAATGYADRVRVFVADGSRGYPEEAPFDRISVAAAAPRVPGPLVDALAPGGILVAPIGDATGQTLMRVRKRRDGAVAREDLGPVRFVPLVGEFGYPAGF